MSIGDGRNNGRGTRFMRAFSEDYVTVDEAAKLLNVAPSTIRRWIREGYLPADRIGKRRVAIRRADLATLITPARPPVDRDGKLAGEESIEIPRLTPEEKERGLAAMERAQRHAKETTALRGGKIFS